MITFTTKLPTNLLQLNDFDAQHPVELRWPLLVKHSYYYSPNAKYIWLLIDGEYAGELVLGWEGFFKDVNVDSFTVLPKYQGQGLGKILINEGIYWAKSKDFTSMTGTARQGASIRTFLSFGATITDVKYNWCETKEDYIGFKIDLKK